MFDSLWTKSWYIIHDSLDSKSIFQSLDLIQDSGNVKKIEGPIRIAKNILVSKIDYSDNFEISFQFKASSIPSRDWQEILIGKLIIIMMNINEYVRLE